MRTPEPNQPSAVSRWVKNATSLLALIVLASCGGGSPQSDTPTPTKLAAVLNISPSPDIAVIDVKKLSETRVSRTVFDYVFSVTFKNNSTAAQSNVAATLTTVGAGATIIDGAVQVGAMGAGASVTPTDTITIRQDRTLPFSPTSLVWQITSAPARQVLTDVRVGLSAEDLASFDGASHRIYRRRLVGVISSSVTSERFDAVMNTVGARMVGYDASTGVVQIQVAEQGNLGALEALASKLAQSGAFESISTQGRSAAEGLPDGMSPNSAITRVGHQLAIRADMIWSVRAAMTSATQVQTIIVDEFGGGMPAFGLPSPADGFSSAVLTVHGYAVAGILAADFDGGTGDFGQVTGVSPAPSPLHVIDMSPGEVKHYYECSWGGCDDIDFIIERLSERFKNQPAGTRFVVNISRGWSNEPVEDYRPKVAIEATRWQKLFTLGGKPGYEHFDYQRDVVQVSSAGNAARDAAWNSGWNQSAMVLKPGSGLVVEARAVNRLASARPTAACRTAYSNFNGNVAAVGGVDARQVSSGDVWTYTSPTTAGFAGAGTSFAAPQVAGMAVALLALKPEMIAKDVVDVIKSTSVSDGCQGAPIVDAYAAILMLDQETRAPVRTALIKGLSAVQSKPTASDAVQFLQAYYPDVYGIQNAAATLDFGRFDLNGDGITGGSTTARFPRIGTAGGENLTDFQALCGLTKTGFFDQTDMNAFKQHILKVAASSPANSTQVLSTCYDASLRVSGSTKMVVGKRQQLGWEILFDNVAVTSPFAQRIDPSMAANLTWQVSGTSLSIDGTGAAQAVSPGIAIVTVSDRSGLKATFTVQVEPADFSFEITQNSPSYACRPATPDVFWSSETCSPTGAGVVTMQCLGTGCRPGRFFIQLSWNSTVQMSQVNLGFYAGQCGTYVWSGTMGGFHDQAYPGAGWMQYGTQQSASAPQGIGGMYVAGYNFWRTVSGSGSYCVNTSFQVQHIWNVYDTETGQQFTLTSSYAMP